MNLDKRIYIKLSEVPKGKITTYGEIAKAVGMKNGQRAVGRIMNKNPYPVIIPCHRVVKSDGKVGGYAYGEEIKSNMLQKEGIKIKNGKISDLEKKIYRF
ncbi:MAG: MGMT family protein [Nitrosarchaeum sp.]|nr:MGMT family protein [Nitrosarchaeum sp.]